MVDRNDPEMLGQYILNIKNEFKIPMCEAADSAYARQREDDWYFDRETGRRRHGIGGRGNSSPERSAAATYGRIYPPVPSEGNGGSS